MEQERNGGGRVVAFEEAVLGRHRHGSRSMHLDIGRGAVDAGRVARSLEPQGAVSRRRMYADGELDVFAAERYFKGAVDGERRKEDGVAVVMPPPPRPLEMVAASARPAVVVSKPVGMRASAASVSASSATSANSRTMLLRGGHRRRHHREKCCVQVGALMRSCSGKRSLRVDSGAAKDVPRSKEPTASKIDWYKELRMPKASLGVAGDGTCSTHGVVAATALPPSLNLGTAKVAAIGREVIREDKPAEFTSSSSRRRSFTLVAPERANVPANGRVGDAGGGGNEREDDDDNDDGSESSSDLFEIKSLMIDDCPYEPSEASIQWSVVTADPEPERGDRVVSARRITDGSHPGRERDGGKGPVARRQSRDRPPALLSGCVSHRAVEVSAAAGPNAPRRR